MHTQKHSEVRYIMISVWDSRSVLSDLDFPEYTYKYKCYGELGIVAYLSCSLSCPPTWLLTHAEYGEQCSCFPMIQCKVLGGPQLFVSSQFVSIF